MEKTLSSNFEASFIVPKTDVLDSVLGSNLSSESKNITSLKLDKSSTVWGPQFTFK